MGIPNFPPRFHNEHMRPFYEGLERGELRLTACKECNKFYWYPPEVSPCHPAVELEWRAVAPEGTIYTFTTVERSLLPGDHKAETPYTVLLAASDDVPGARIPSLFIGGEGAEPRCGMRVRLHPVTVGDHILPAFKPL